MADGLWNYGYGGREGAEGVDNWYTHARYTVVYGTGLLSLLAGLTGLGLALYRLDRRLAVFLTFPVLYYSFFSSQKIIHAGNLIPVYPFMAILAAYAIHELTAVLASLLHKKVKRLFAERAILTGLLVATLWFPLSVTLALNRSNNTLDTGTVAAQWIEGHFPPGTHFALERNTVVLDGERYQITMEPRLINRAVRDYRAEGVEYLIVSSEFEPQEGKLVGPTRRILRVPPEEG